MKENNEKNGIKKVSRLTKRVTDEKEKKKSNKKSSEQKDTLLKKKDSRRKVSSKEKDIEKSFIADDIKDSKMSEKKLIVKRTRKKLSDSQADIDNKEVADKKNKIVDSESVQGEEKEMITKSKSVRKNRKSKSLVKAFFSKVLWMLLGFLVCLLLFFVLCGGKNYFKLYYELRDFVSVYDAVTTDYYGELDKNELISEAIDAMFVSINDYYTTYIDKDSADSFLEDVNGTYEGIGCTVATTVDGEIFVVEVFEDSPSSEAGLKEDDVILKVNGEDYSDKTSLDMSDFVKNSNLDKIVLTIKREDKVFDITIKREEIEIPAVSSQVIEYNDKNIGYITIDVFSSVSYEQIKSRLEKLEKRGISGLVVDVRNNNGGYLNAVTDISSLFLKKGNVIYQLEDEDGVSEVKDTSKASRSYPIAVVVNGGSASASEIFAAAIKESYGGFVVGTSTYGKGTVQKTKVLNDGSIIKYTTQKWLTPDGNFINEVGLIPTHEVDLDYSLGYDNQLDEALKLVVEEIE